MDNVLAAVFFGMLVVVGVLIPVGILVCVLGIVTDGSIPVLVTGAGLGIALACYCGYRTALSILGRPSKRKPVIRIDEDRSKDRGGRPE
jgi:hypothetical protein